MCFIVYFMCFTEKKREKKFFMCFNCKCVFLKLQCVFLTISCVLTIDPKILDIKKIEDNKPNIQPYQLSQTKIFEFKRKIK